VATYYIDKDAVGSHNGTSWSNAWTVFSQVTGVGPNDVVYISGGASSKTYSDKSLILPGGGSGTPVTYRVGVDTGHTGTVIFDGGGSGNWLYGNNSFALTRNVVVDGLVGSTNKIQVQNYSLFAYTDDGYFNVTVRGVTGTGKVRMYGCSGITLSKLILGPDVGVDGAFTGLGGTDYTSNLIQDCTFYLYQDSTEAGYGDDGIQNISAGTISRCRFIAVPTASYSGNQHQDGIQTSGKVWVDSCYFENIANYGFYGEFFSDGGDQILTNNIFFADDPVITSGATAGIAIGTSAAGKNVSGVVLANNTVVGYGRGITLGGGYNSTTTVDSFVVNNVTSGCGLGFELIRSIDGSGNRTYTGAGIHVYNCKSQAANGTSVSVAMNDAGSEPNTDSVTFVSSTDFHLSSSDTGAIGQGYDYSSLFTTDYAGNTRTAPWDIGAYEYATTVPSAPTLLTATAVSTSVISLGWTNNATDADGIYVERSSDGTNYAQIASLGPTDTAYSATGLASGTQYWFRVRAYNANGNSAYSNTDDATTGYKIDRSLDGLAWSEVAAAEPGASSYYDTGLLSGQGYYYRVCVSTRGTLSCSNIKVGTTPAAPAPGAGRQLGATFVR
jgi:hypothetical protein